MDVFERLFGIAPDGGSGSLEATYAAVAILVGAAIAGRGRIVAVFRSIAQAGRGKRR